MRKKLLLADDSITIQKVVELTFPSDEFEVVTAGNGRLAVDKASTFLPDVVLCDVIMPQLDGYQVCEALRAIPGLQDVPILLLNGAFEPYDAERALAVGALGNVSKPFDPPALVTRVKEVLAARASMASDRPDRGVSLDGSGDGLEPVIDDTDTVEAPMPETLPPVSTAPEYAYDESETAPVSTVEVPLDVREMAARSLSLDAPVFAEPEPEILNAEAELSDFSETLHGSVDGDGETLGEVPEASPFEHEEHEPGGVVADQHIEALGEEAMELGEPSPFEPVHADEVTELGEELPPPGEPEPETPQEALTAIGDEPAIEADAEPEPQPEFAPEPAAEEAMDSGLDGSLPEAGLDTEAVPDPGPAEFPQPGSAATAAPEPDPADMEPAPVEMEPYAVDVEPAPASLEMEAAPAEIGGIDELPSVETPEAPQAPSTVSTTSIEDSGAFDDLVGPTDAPGASAPLAAVAASSAGTPSAEVPVPVDMVQQIAQRVISQVSERVIREIAWEVIPVIAEKLVKAEIERIKARAESERD